MTYLEFAKPALNAAMEAEKVWVNELMRVYPKEYPNVRYTPLARGDAGTYLRAASEAYSAAMTVYHRAKEQGEMLEKADKLVA